MIRLAGAVLLAVSLAGCGGTSASLDEAAQATSAETARFEMDYRVSGEAEKFSFTMHADGTFDFPNERAGMTISGDVPFFAGEDIAWKEFRLLGKTGFMKWLVKGKTYWVRSHERDSSGEGVELLIPLPGTPTRPTDVLARVLAASVETKELGSLEVRGTDTAHYRARVDVEKLAKQVRPDDRVEEVGRAQFVPVELWIDEENRLRRITTEESNEDEKMTMAVELYDYGVEVDVEPPPEDETITEDEFDKLTGSFVERDAPASEPLSPDELCMDARGHLPKKEADELCASLKEKQ